MKIFVLVLSLITVHLAPAHAYAFVVNSLFAFGDSYSDSGNSAMIPGTSPRPVPYAGTPPSYYDGGRFTNGPVWVEQLASRLGVTADPSEAGGTNYAFGGAKTGPLANPPGSASPSSLLDQSGAFLTASGDTAPSNALYAIFGGINDVFNDALPIAAGGGDPSVVLDTAVGNISQVISDLAAAGATTFIVPNLFDLGLTPQIVFVGTPSDPATARVVVQDFNTRLATELAGLENQLAIKLINFDLFDLVDTMASDPASFGFTDIRFPWAFSAPSTSTPDEHLFWDGIHATAAFHQIFGDAAFNDVVAQVAEPSIFALWSIGALGLGCSVRRRWRGNRLCSPFTSCLKQPA